MKIAISVAEHESQITEAHYKELLAILGGPDNQEMTAMEKAAYERDAYLPTDFVYDVIAPTEDAKDDGSKSSIVLVTKWELERKDLDTMVRQQYFRVPWPVGIEVEDWCDGIFDTQLEPDEVIKSMDLDGFELRKGLAEQFLVYLRTGEIG